MSLKQSSATLTEQELLACHIPLEEWWFKRLLGQVQEGMSATPSRLTITITAEYPDSVTAPSSSPSRP